MCTAIENLPSELLAHIFHLVLHTQHCAKRDYPTGNFAAAAGHVYPIILSHVCSRWRDITLNTSTLWSHIDVSTLVPPNQPRYNGLIEFYLNHAKQTPLELHLFDPVGYPVSPSNINEPLHELIMAFASRTFSFNLDATDTCTDVPDIHGPLLSTFFKGCMHGELKQLVMRHDHDYKSGFIRARDDPDDDGINLDLPMEQLETLLAGVSILRLDQLFPRWTSQAYHGLTELRLNGLSPSIRESDLIGILRLSPSLRILELGLYIKDPLPIDTPVTTISLSNLEVMNIFRANCEQLTCLFRLLAPGLKPLQFAIQQRIHKDLQLKAHLGSFLSHSLVTRVYGKGLNFSHLVELLELLPNLEELVASRMRIQHPNPSERKEITGTVLGRHLERIYITQSSIHIEDIHALVSIRACLVKSIVLQWCMLSRNGLAVSEDQEGALLGECQQKYPEVRLIIRRTGEPSPVKSWDLFAPYDFETR